MTFNNSGYSKTIGDADIVVKMELGTFSSINFSVVRNLNMNREHYADNSDFSRDSSQK